MTHAEFCHSLARRHKIPVETVKQVMDAFPKELLVILKEGDEIKVNGLGTFYPAKYEARKGQLEFGTKGTGGQRTRVRFRPYESTNWKLTNT